jgi:hypothetical protein
MKNKNIYWLQNKNERLIRILISALTNTRSCSRSKLSYLCIKKIWIVDFLLDHLELILICEVQHYFFKPKSRKKTKNIFCIIHRFCSWFFLQKIRYVEVFDNFEFLRKMFLHTRADLDQNLVLKKIADLLFLHITSPYLAILVFRLIINIITYYPFSLYIVLK